MPKVGWNPKRHLIHISGKDSLCTAIVQLARNPNLPYEFLFIDVKAELPETYEWLSKVEKFLNCQITKIGKSLEEIMDEENMLPSFNRRFCTKLGKIFPVYDSVGKDEVVQYFGIRADEADRVQLFSGPKNVTALYPLVEMGIGIETVYEILNARGIMPPDFFWEKLFEEVYKRRLTTTSRRTVDNLKPWQKSALFSWRSRSNCYHCFYQRKYEWIGLLEHHPNLFNRAEELEIEFGSVNSPRKLGLKKDFYWMPGESLAHLRNRAESIFIDRVENVRKEIERLTWHSSGKINVDTDLMNLTSCGLFCGK